MFIKAFLAATCFALGVSAQTIQIGYPKAGSHVTVGQNFTVEVDRPVSL
jgi:hypothetical protein